MLAKRATIWEAAVIARAAAWGLEWAAAQAVAVVWVAQAVAAAQAAVAAAQAAVVVAQAAAVVARAVAVVAAVAAVAAADNNTNRAFLLD